jgi:hypothetical protein
MLVASGLGSLATAGRTEAGLLQLQMSGVTSDPSDFAGTGISAGTPWSLVAEFDPATLIPSFGDFLKAPTTSLTVIVGGTTYTPNEGTSVLLAGPADDAFGAGIVDSEFASGLIPIFGSSSNPNWTASDPTSTVFSSPVDAVSNNWQVPTSGGDLYLTTDFAGTSASITGVSPPAVPEPSLVSLAIGGAAFGLVALRRRARRG